MVPSVDPTQNACCGSCLSMGIIIISSPVIQSIVKNNRKLKWSYVAMQKSFYFKNFPCNSIFLLQPPKINLFAKRLKDQDAL